MKKVYIFSGLGVDKRVFQKIDFGNLDIEFVEWIEPRKDERIEEYAKRISQKIIVENPILIGLSFGGIIAVEVAKTLAIEKLILIASAKTRNEIPMLYRILGKLKIHNVIPASFLKSANCISNWFFGAQIPSDKILLKQILEETDNKFLYWALDKVVTWRNLQTPQNYVHIHGLNDRILPIKNIKTDYKIQGGGHFMTVNKSEEVSKLLKKSID
ncbi:alpha/beta hydrolase [Sphingobacterium haloxyli]|uniref:Alpha/beta hydrolase n=1 Tax=Sphingobacterium haloxyli TaxID=2100533 RepID=A0A2S9J022_9SPHI|nr:alpha/beta hydrolase [Sphingobacterium haloxyli]PRD46136.1 alpha/beta hydrolase [Sphingobacterium haloxyli]